jgi:hypothetical protein
VALPISTQRQGVRAKIGWLVFGTMGRSGVTCLPAECCFSELVL